MASTIKHTFIILAYQNSPYLQACIQSLLNQTTPSLIRLSTSTPSDHITALSQKYNIPLLINPNPHGIAADWSFAYQNCKTEYLTLAHQDDLYLPEYTELYFAAATKYKKNLIIFSDYNELYHNQIRENNLLLLFKRLLLNLFFLFKQNLSSAGYKKKILSFGNPVCCPSIMYHVKNIGPFTFNSSYTMNLDWDAALRLSGMQGDFVYVKRKLITRRIHEGSESTNALTNRTRHEEDRKIFERLWPAWFAGWLSLCYKLAYKSNG